MKALTDLSPLQRMALATSLRSAFSGKHFDVCPLDRAADVVGAVTYKNETYATLRAFHCVEFGAMPSEAPALLLAEALAFLGLSAAFGIACMQAADPRRDTAAILAAMPAPGDRVRPILSLARGA